MFYTMSRQKEPALSEKEEMLLKECSSYSTHKFTVCNACMFAHCIHVDIIVSFSPPCQDLFWKHTMQHWAIRDDLAEDQLASTAEEAAESYIKTNKL